MCGIAGFVDLRGRFHAEALRELATRMANTMLHRGPDDGGAWVDPTGYCAFSQRRLSIIDLSPAGHQPMQSSDGRTCITFNGEIYNFNDLRSELESNGRTLRTRTDTEVLLEAIRAYGTETFLKLDGMYAFAFFDEQTSDLILARDPFGEKPLYYTHQNGYFAFASELHALPVLPQFDATIDEEAIAQLFMLQYVHAPRTIYRSAKKLPPGHWLRLSRDGTIRIEQFYKFTPQSGPFEDRSLDDLADELKEILVRSVRRRMISDVPVGAFLSGGVDSSLVVALIARELGHKVKTFSIGFDKAPESEHLFARQMAERLGTDHHDKILAPDILNLATMIGQILDEPNGDSSCLPTYLISEFARRQVTVSLW